MSWRRVVGGDDVTTLSLRGAMLEETAADGIGAVAAPKHCVERGKKLLLWTHLQPIRIVNGNFEQERQVRPAGFM